MNLKKKKIFILLPDGISLKNFAFTEFYNLGIDKEFEIIFWNNTPFDLSELNFSQILFNNPKIHPFTNILKKAKGRIELKQSIKRTCDEVFDSYTFPKTNKSVKGRIKNLIEKWVIFKYNSQKGLKKISKRINALERKTEHYKKSYNTLLLEKPDFVFCTNQRITEAVAPILAAQDLKIPTATFIFSWDNIPKGTKALDTDYYFVWSQHMKNELLFYYPYILDNQIFVTGTPQFELHNTKKLLISHKEFFIQNQLDINKKYICFSGDDITTSPNDSIYLENTAQAVRNLNAKGNNIGIIFRRCPVDFSKRYDEVLKMYDDIIVPIEPKWILRKDSWRTILPTKEDLVLQMNTINNTEFVINIGSSMVFDYACFDKPCCFINYDVNNPIDKNWTVKKVYNFIHFRSMPNHDSVIWINSEAELESKIELLLSDKQIQTVNNSKKWFEKINLHPKENASERIWNEIKYIVEKR